MLRTVISGFYCFYTFKNSTVNLTRYPRDQNINTTVSVNGTYLQVALNSSATSDVRLSFEMTYLNDIIGSTTVS